MKNTIELSIFIDESGDFGEVCNGNDYYLVTFVFHDRSDNIASEANYLETRLRNAGYRLDYIHTAPIIRREQIFENYSLDERRKLLYELLAFTIKCPIKHTTIKVRRKDVADRKDLACKISYKITEMVRKNAEYFSAYDKLTVYYDNGQHELSMIISSIFNEYFANVEYIKAQPQEYILLQVADFICTIELLKIKKEEGRLSKSEIRFFYKPQELKKTFIKAIDKKSL
ncbi:MAG: DUF3800 domain-containing protein [Lachnospiraceae bacterium]|nr:DUF3800 domain-containing protein [Lachnospiraceae bacterium]MBO4461531.1 DUF3800 domain-containing protein [Lachnospiraceae bacterium]